MNASANPQKTQTKSREILIGCRSIVIGFCETQSDLFLAEASQQLFEQSSKVKDNNQQRQYFEASQYLEKNAGKLGRHLEKSVKQGFKLAFTGELTDPADNTDSERLEAELSLVKNSQMEIDVAITAMASRVESDCAEELFGLTQRTAMLNKGVKLTEDNAPYGPRFLGHTFHAFIAEAELEQAIQLMLLKLFERSFAARMLEMYQELNRYLITANVLPNLRYNNAPAKGTAPRRRKSDQLLAESEQRQAELYKSIESILNSAPSAIDPSQPMMSTEQVLQELLSLQQQPVENILAQAASSALPNTNVLPMQQALECVSLLFDIVYSEQNLGAPVKNILSHLRTPYARIALSDPAFLANPEHDARQLMQSLMQASERWTDNQTDPANELVQRIKSVVERIIDDVSDAKQMDPGMFGELLDEFNQYIDTFERKIKLTEQRNVQAAEGREKLKENQLRVDELVAEKIEGQDLPAPVKQLIEDIWSSYLTYILLRHGDEGEQWEAAVAAIDSLLWYIEPKTTDEEIAKADSVKESLHTVLSNGMNSVGLDAPDIKARLNGLELCRKLATENASTPSQPGSQPAEPEQSAAAQPANVQPTDVQPTDVQPSSVATGQDPDELVGDAAKSTPAATNEAALAQQESASSTAKNRIQQQKAKLERTASELIDNTDVETRKASKFDIDRVLQLKFGTWLNWNRPGEEPRQVKLTWYNARTRNCMLSDRSGKELGMLPANAVALGLADGWITVAEQETKKPLFERMLEAVTGKRSKNQATGNSAR